MQKVLVTGGTGYIGSHTVVELQQAGYQVVIVDNLYNSKESVLDRIEQITGVRPEFYQVDLLDAPALEQVFAGAEFASVLHFAGLKAVAESVEQPLRYYQNNITGTLNLLDCMQRHGVRRIIFSSSATVYGDQGVGLLNEEMQTGVGITNPYGQTKFMIEQILRDVCMADAEFSATILRYFNPVGAHASGLLGEDPNGRPNNLMPVVMKVATREIPELSIYGDDYPTPDGTCVRDYIHVVDLAQGHVAALEKMLGKASANLEEASAKNQDASAKSEDAHANHWVAYNLGTGRGTSVKEMVAAFEEASGRPLPHRVVARRPGDLPELCADASKAARELGWQTHLTIADAMRDTLRYLDRQ